MLDKSAAVVEPRGSVRCVSDVKNFVQLQAQ